MKEHPITEVDLTRESKNPILNSGNRLAFVKIKQLIEQGFDYYLVTAVLRKDKEVCIVGRLGEVYWFDPQQEPESKWISVDDRLPDDTGTRYKVFAICKKKIEIKDETSQYFNKGIIGVYQDWNIRQWPDNFTHWMPLPLPPKEQNEPT